MTIDQIIWLSTFIVATILSIFFISGAEKQQALYKIFTNPINWVFLSLIAGAIIYGIVTDDTRYHKALGLSIIALLTSIFVELRMIFAPFFLVICFVMAFPDLF